jgi:hypothetical protein
MACENTRFEVRDGDVEVVAAGLRREPRDLERLARSTVAFASRGVDLRRWWQARAKAVGAQLERDAEAGWRIAIDDRPIPIRIETRLPDRETATTTRVTAQLVERGHHVYRLERADAEAGPPDELLPPGYRIAFEDSDESSRRFPELRATIAELGPRRIDCDGDEVVVELDDVEGDPDKLDRAIALATALAGRQQGPYR